MLGLWSLCKSELCKRSPFRRFLTACGFRFALNIRISDVVMRKDKHVKVITDEMIVNICM